MVGFALDSNYAMVASVVGTTRYLTLVGGTNSGFVLTERFEADTGLRDTTYGPLKGEGPDHTSWSSGPSGTAYAAALDNNVNKVVISGSGGNNDFLVARFNNDGTLDASFGGAGPNGPSGADGSIRIDFGPYNGITTDGARTIALRTVNGAVDILVGGYTFDTGTQKYKIALVDLLDDHFFHVT